MNVTAAKGPWRKYIVFFAVGVAYLVFVRATGLKLPCLFYTCTGLRCPGCGITTMCVALSRGDFAAAFQANGFLLLTLPLPVLLFFLDRKQRRKGESGSRLLQGIIWLYLIAAVAFGVIRNLW